MAILALELGERLPEGLVLGALAQAARVQVTRDVGVAKAGLHDPPRLPSMGVGGVRLYRAQKERPRSRHL